MAPKAGNNRLYKVVFDLPGGARTIEVGGNEFILEAARRAGIELPSLCERGWCCTCAVKVLSGTIDQSASLRYFEEDRRAGFALICTGRPRSDLYLRPGAVEEMRAHRDAHHLPVPRGTRARSITSLPEQPSQAARWIGAVLGKACGEDGCIPSDRDDGLGDPSRQLQQHEAGL